MRSGNPKLRGFGGIPGGLPTGARNLSADGKIPDSLGSSNEVVVLLKLARDLGFGETEELIRRYDELGKRIYRLREIWVAKVD